MNLMVLFIVNSLIAMFILLIITKNMHKIKLFNIYGNCYMNVSYDELKKIKDNIQEENGEKFKLTKTHVILNYRKYSFNEDNQIIVLNDKGILMEELMGIIAIAFQLTPFILLLKHNIMSIVFMFLIGLMMYHYIILALRYVLNNIVNVNKTIPYKFTYLAYIFHFNRITILCTTTILIAVFATKGFWTIVVLCLILIKIHLTLFIDKLGFIFKIDVLNNEYLDKQIKIEAILNKMLIPLGFILLALYYPQINLIM